MINRIYIKPLTESSLLNLENDHEVLYIDFYRYVYDLPAERDQGPSWYRAIAAALPIYVVTLKNDASVEFFILKHNEDCEIVDIK